jgi:hypothetical protein
VLQVQEEQQRMAMDLQSSKSLNKTSLNVTPAQLAAMAKQVLFV